MRVGFAKEKASEVFKGREYGEAWLDKACAQTSDLTCIGSKWLNSEDHSYMHGLHVI